MSAAKLLEVWKQTGYSAAGLVALSQLALSQLHAQSTFGTMLGTVKDPAGAISVGCRWP